MSSRGAAAHPVRKPESRLALWHRAVAFAEPYHRAVLGIVGITLLLATINAGEPLVLKFIFDDLVPRPNARTLVIGVAGLLALGVVREAAGAVSNWLTGTTLSAVVAEALRQGGWDVRRATLRPIGHPFERRAMTPLTPCESGEPACVVDEGPGASGSSMAAAAEALVAGGFERRSVSFFPGHSNPPGPAASDRVRQWWMEAPRSFVPLERMDWGGNTLVETLAAATAEREGMEVVASTDVSAGAWRAVAYGNGNIEDWPAVCGAFGRTKFLCRLSDGRAVLWKFSGLGLKADRESEGSSESAPDRECPRRIPVVAHCSGFSAQPWIDGRRLWNPDGSRADIRRQLTAYLAQSAGIPLSPKVQGASLQRLVEIIHWNTLESFGEAVNLKWKRMVPSASQLLSTPSYGDGRMAPHEWVLARDGVIWKADGSGHTRGTGPNPRLD
jgi:hypothetical protein